MNTYFVYPTYNPYLKPEDVLKYQKSFQKIKTNISLPIYLEEYAKKERRADTIVYLVWDDNGRYIGQYIIDVCL